MSEQQTGGRFSGRTAWARNLETPLRSFLRTETGSAAFLLAAAVVALVWVNVDAGSYDRVWEATFTISIGSHGLSEPVRYWLNSGLMAFFFFVIGLEARREFDMGELRERRRVTLPVVAGLAGMIVPVAIYLAFNLGTSSAHGFGAAMSTDTAFALGLLAIVGPRFPDRLRAFMLTVSVVDDVVALIVIATVYSTTLALDALGISIAVLAVAMVLARSGIRGGLVYLVLGVTAWIAMSQSGIDPIVVGLAMGLMTYASNASRTDLERATDLFRLFREQPTPELARSASLGLQAAISPNERLQQLFHPWTSYVIVPLFALANAGIAIDTSFLRHAYTSPVTLGILFGYVAGKPIGITGGSLLVTKLTRGRLRPPVGWAAVAGGGFIAGIGFTVSLLIADLAFTGTTLAEAKLGLLSAAAVASVSTWVLFRATSKLPTRLRIRALLGTSELLIDLAVPVDPERDHIRGPNDAKVTLVEYGDLECPFCGQAEPVVRELLADIGDLRYVWRHLPLSDVHPRAELAAEASEAASAQGKFWEMHDLLIDHQDELAPKDLVEHARALGLDVDRFSEALRRHSYRSRIAEDVDGADLSGVSGTPTFFVNGLRHYGAYDVETLTAAVKAARARALVAA
ncbi:MAG TPA: Na+/H+ antiporter NhaA [Gaiellaceae bacterium]|nr:Na+/H+ antiporter NhaA [Gaiellaceae bacterium]